MSLLAIEALTPCVHGLTQERTPRAALQWGRDQLIAERAAGLTIRLSMICQTGGERSSPILDFLILCLLRSRNNLK